MKRGREKEEFFLIKTINSSLGICYLQAIEKSGYPSKVSKGRIIVSHEDVDTVLSYMKETQEKIFHTEAYQNTSGELTIVINPENIQRYSFYIFPKLKYTEE